MSVEIPPLPKCIIKGCDNNAKTRGLCGGCYSTAVKVVKDGTMTWQQLEEMGLTLSLRRKRRPISSPFGIALAEKVAAEMRKQGATVTVSDTPESSVGADQIADAMIAQGAERINLPDLAAQRAERKEEQADLAERRARRAEIAAEQQAADKPVDREALRAEADQRNLRRQNEREATRERMAERQTPPAEPVIPADSPEPPQDAVVAIPGAHAASEAPKPEASPVAASEPQVPVLPWQVQQNTAPGGSKPK